LEVISHACHEIQIHNSRPSAFLRITFNIHARPIYNAAFSPDGRLLASMDLLGKSIKFWEVSTGRELCAINMGAQTTMTWAINSAFAFSPDSLSLFSVSGGTLKQWDARTGREIRSVDLNQGKSIGSAYFSADTRVLATLNEKGSLLSVWEVESGRKLYELRRDSNNNERPEAFALSPDGRERWRSISSQTCGMGNRTR
jgi:WD40 repeat protein